MKIEPTFPSGSTPITPKASLPLHSLPESMGPASATPPSASEVLGHLLDLPHNVDPEILQKTLFFTFLSALHKK